MTTAKLKAMDKKIAEIDEHISEIYDFRKRLGKGAYGIVWKAMDKRNKETFAIKKIFDAFRDETDAQRTFREIVFLKAFRNHPNVIKLMSVFRASNNLDIYLIFEFMESDLHNIIKKGTILKDVHKRYVMYQLINAIKYIHSGNVIHRDLKPSNILIDSKCRCKLADFGLARSLSMKQPQTEQIENSDPHGGQLLTDYVATRWYRAPEILVASKSFTHNISYTKGIDMWSLGCILGEMIRGKPLFQGSSTVNQIEKIVNALPAVTVQDLNNVGKGFGSVLLHRKTTESATTLADLLFDAPIDAIHLVKSLLVLDPLGRLTAKEALCHPYVERFRNSISEADLETDIQPPFSDDVRLTVPEYRSKLYEIVKCINPNELDDGILNQQQRMDSYTKILVAPPNHNRSHNHGHSHINNHNHNHNYLGHYYNPKQKHSFREASLGNSSFKPHPIPSVKRRPCFTVSGYYEPNCKGEIPGQRRYIPPTVVPSVVNHPSVVHTYIAKTDLNDPALKLQYKRGLTTIGMLNGAGDREKANKSGATGIGSSLRFDSTEHGDSLTSETPSAGVFQLNDCFENGESGGGDEGGDIKITDHGIGDYQYLNIEDGGKIGDTIIANGKNEHLIIRNSGIGDADLGKCMAIEDYFTEVSSAEQKELNAEHNIGTRNLPVNNTKQNNKLNIVNVEEIVCPKPSVSGSACDRRPSIDCGYASLPRDTSVTTTEPKVDAIEEDLTVETNNSLIPNPSNTDADQTSSSQESPKITDTLQSGQRQYYTHLNRNCWPVGGTLPVYNRMPTNYTYLPAGYGYTTGYDSGFNSSTNMRNSTASKPIPQYTYLNPTTTTTTNSNYETNSNPYVNAAPVNNQTNGNNVDSKPFKNEHVCYAERLKVLEHEIEKYKRDVKSFCKDTSTYNKINHISKDALFMNHDHKIISQNHKMQQQQRRPSLINETLLASRIYKPNSRISEGQYLQYDQGLVPLPHNQNQNHFRSNGRGTLTKIFNNKGKMTNLPPVTPKLNDSGCRLTPNRYFRLPMNNPHRRHMNAKFNNAQDKNDIGGYGTGGDYLQRTKISDLGQASIYRTKPLSKFIAQ